MTGRCCLARLAFLFILGCLPSDTVHAQRLPWDGWYPGYRERLEEMLEELKAQIDDLEGEERQALIDQYEEEALELMRQNLRRLLEDYAQRNCSHPDMANDDDCKWLRKYIAERIDSLIRRLKERLKRLRDKWKAANCDDHPDSDECRRLAEEIEAVENEIEELERRRRQLTGQASQAHPPIVVRDRRILLAMIRTELVRSQQEHARIESSLQNALRRVEFNQQPSVFQLLMRDLQNRHSKLQRSILALIEHTKGSVESTTTLERLAQLRREVSAISKLLETSLGTIDMNAQPAAFRTAMTELKKQHTMLQESVANSYTSVSDAFRGEGVPAMAEIQKILDGTQTGEGGVVAAPKLRKDDEPLDEKWGRSVLIKRPNETSEKWKIKIPLEELEDE